VQISKAIIANTTKTDSLKVATSCRWAITLTSWVRPLQVAGGQLSDRAMNDAVTALRKTNRPVGLLAWKVPTHG